MLDFKKSEIYEHVTKIFLNICHSELILRHVYLYIYISGVRAQKGQFYGLKLGIIYCYSFLNYVS
jgi:hypothetical protein